MTVFGNEDNENKLSYNHTGGGGAVGFTHSIYLVPYRIYLKNKSERHRHYHLNIKETSASEKF